MGIYSSMDYPKKSNDREAQNRSEEKDVGTVSQPDCQNKPSELDTAHWDNEGFNCNPDKWPPKRKWLVSTIASFSALLVGINSPAILSGKRQIEDQFNVKDGQFPSSYLLVTSWCLGSAVIPIFLLPLMETFGIRYGYLISYITFIIFLIPQALAKNFATLIVARIISGGCAGILTNVVGGIISDLWPRPTERSVPLALYIWSYYTGVTIGPVIGGAIIRSLAWRWISYVQLIVYSAWLPAVAAGIPETKHFVIHRRLACKLRKVSGNDTLSSRIPQVHPLNKLFLSALCRPLHILFAEPVIFAFTLWASFCTGTVYLFANSISQVYQTNYGWDTFLAGSVQAAMAIGELFGALLSLLQNKIYVRSTTQSKQTPQKPVPEARLYLSISGNFLGLTAGFFWFGWMSYPSLHWILPTLGLTLVGLGIVTVACSVSMYIIDNYANYAASAMAAVAFGQNIFAALLPLATGSMYTKLGFQWASSLLGFVALALSFVPILLYFKGHTIREKSTFIRQASRED